MTYWRATHEQLPEDLQPAAEGRDDRRCRHRLPGQLAAGIRLRAQPDPERLRPIPDRVTELHSQSDVWRDFPAAVRHRPERLRPRAVDLRQ